MKKLLFLAAIFCCSFGVNPIFQLTLTRVESRKTKMIKDGTWEAYYKEKQLLQQTFNDKYQKLNDFDELEYIGDFFIGTPPQKFKFHYDITSTDFWVTDKSCGTTDNTNFHCPQFCLNPNVSSYFCDPQCNNPVSTVAPESLNRICNQKTKYDSTKSSTFWHLNELWNEDYELGYISGRYKGEDRILLGAKNKEFGLLSVNQSIFLQTNALSPVFVDTPFDGILGIGAGKTAVLLSTNQKFDKLYTVYLEEINDKEEYNVTGGYITFGGIDKEHCETEIFYQSALPQYSFMIFNISFETPTTSAQNPPSIVTVDTARDSIVGPAEDIKNLKKAAGAAEDGTIDCNAEIKDLSIQMGMEFDAKILTIPKHNLIIYNSDGSCKIALESMPPNSSDQKKWIFGTPWLRSYCNIFSFEDGYKISFANVKK